MSIRLSQKHGVNPSVMLCFYCGEASGVALLGQLPGDREAPRQAAYDKVPCAKCKDLMQKGIMFIEVRNGEEGDNPYRMGPMVVITEEAFERIGVQPQELHDGILQKRVAFIDQDTWDHLGLPRENTP